MTVAVGDGLGGPNSNEWTAGLARQLGDLGSVRVDYVQKDYRDFYGDFRDPSTGKVTDPTGRVYDLTVVKNTDLANLARLRSIEPADLNDAGRPNTYTIKDDARHEYRLTAEELREALNWPLPGKAPTLPHSV